MIEKITSDLFKGYYIPTPIDDTYFCMETCELVKIKVDWQSVREYFDTGEIINLKYNDDKKMYEMDMDADWFWYDGDEENEKIFDMILDYFTDNEGFKQACNTLYKELLSEKQMLGTINEYMFLQRFTNISRISLE